MDTSPGRGLTPSAGAPLPTDTAFSTGQIRLELAVSDHLFRVSEGWPGCFLAAGDGCAEPSPRSGLFRDPASNEGLAGTLCGPRSVAVLVVAVAGRVPGGRQRRLLLTPR